MSKNLKIAAISLILLGLTARIAVVYVGGPSPHFDENINTDEINYLELASNIADTKCYGAWSEGFYTQSTRSPGYPSFLAFFNLFCGKGHPWLPQILNILLESLNIILVYLVGRTIYGRRAGLAAALLYSLLGACFIYVKLATSEIFSVTLLLTTCFYLAGLKSHYRYSIAGFVIAFACLIHTKPAFLLVLPFAALFIYVGIPYEKMKARILKSAIPILIIALLCIPWTVRNYRVHKTVIPVCTFAGWHLLADARNSDLSLEDLTNFIYDPGRKGFTEGDYFSESRKMFLESFSARPVSHILTGIGRFSIYWIPQEPWLRVFQPKAYIMPVYLTGKFFIPFPDFEGIIYLSLLLPIFLAFRLGRKFLPDVRKWAVPGLPIILLIAFYSAVHVISMPLEQYRFLIEPLYIILLSGFFSTFFFHEKYRHSCSLSEVLHTTPILVFLCIALAAILINNPTRQSFAYPNSEPHGSAIKFSEVRSLQWKNLGNIPAGTICETSGEVRYLSKGLLYDGSIGRALKSENAAVGKLYVGLDAPGNPKGLGDLKLNFHNSTLPSDGQKVKVRGTVSTGGFKDIIMDVDSWERLD